MGLSNPAIANAKIINLRAADGPSLTAGLGQMLGSVQPVRIEVGSILDPVYFHSIKPLSASLAIYAAYAKVQPDISMDKASALFVAAGSGSLRQEAALDALRTVFVGPSSNDVNRTANGNREAFYSNLDLLLNNASFKALSGQVQLVQAGPSFTSAAQGNSNSALAYRYALLELLPFAVVANTAAQNQTLYSYYTQRLSLYNPSTGQGELTQTWLADRATLLQGLVALNSADKSYDIPLPGNVNANYTYTDIASNQVIKFRGTASNAAAQQSQQVMFGNEPDNTLVGSDAVAAGLGDRLYGGAGNDTLSGLGGADYLEGNSGNDTLDGGAGNDVLLGGAGNDTYQFKGSYGKDTILDSDGQGSIQIDGATLNGGAQYGDNRVYRGADIHYKFKSCLRPYLLACSKISYPKTAKKVSPDVSASCARAGGNSKDTMNSVALRP